MKKKKEGKNFLNKIKGIITSNKLFIVFVIINLINSIILRTLTIGGLLLISPFLADLTILLILGSIGYFFGEKKQIIYYVVMSFILTLLCTINSSYYTYYTSFSSISLLSTTRFIFQVGDAVVESVIKIKDIIYYIVFGIGLLFYIINYKKSNNTYGSKKKVLYNLGCALVTTLFFCLTLNSKDIQKLLDQFNRCYIVNKYGIYTYHLNDLVKSLEPKVTSIVGYDESLKEFNEYYKNRETIKKENEWTNKYVGKNLIGIHAESIQNFLIGLKINGKEVTPNLNKLASNSLYFSNFYSQVSVGTSSDTEFTLATSLMPSNSGTAFGNFYDKTYISMPALLRDKGYYTFAMHGNTAGYWNRDVMHKTLGYDYFYAKDSFDIDETVGLGLSDHSFFKQSIEKLKQINKEHDKYYGTMITLSNHTPFSDLEKYGEFDVTLNVKDKTYPYLDGTKLGNYLKSAHYADKCLGEFISALNDNNLLDNTVLFLYGDHDARLPLEDFIRMYNYDYQTDDILDESNKKYKKFDEYSYEINRKVPLIIYEKNTTPQKIDSLMGMYDVMPTLGNMFGFYNKYALGHDIFNNLDSNIVVFSTGNWITDRVYYNSQKNEYLALKESVISDDYIEKNNNYSDNLLNISNKILLYDLIKNSNTKNADESKIIK